MKKLLCLLLALMMVVTLFACDSKNDRDDDDEDEDDTTISEEKEDEKEDTEKEEEEEEVEVEVEVDDTDSDEAVAAWVEENGESYLEELEYGFAISSGLTCTSSIEAKGCGVVVYININELDEVTDEQKAEVQATYDEMGDDWAEALEELQDQEPAIESLTIYVCEVDGDIIATIYAEN